MKTVFLLLWSLLSIAIVALLSVVAVAGALNFGDGFGNLIFLPLIYIALILVLIKSLQYYFVEYILTDEPEISWRDALSKSKAMTDGNKWRMFLLSLSFLGWLMLGVVCLGIGAILVMPYIQATFSELYLKLKEDCVYSQNDYEEI